MARHPKAETVKIASWEEADAALLELGRLREHDEALKDALRRFADRRRADFGESQSRQLLHGRIGFRTRVRRKVGSLDETIDLLRRAGLEEAVVEDVKWDVLEGLSKKELAELGIRLETYESFAVEPARALPAS